MTFVHPLLLGGLLLAGLPVLIHLIMQQRPKRLPFPAFRFLVQKQRTNQRSLRLRHLLLLLLRIGIIALLCLAFVRPKVFSERLDLSGRRPVAVAVVVDTSLSMEYAVAGKTRLDDAKRRASELLDELPDGSRVAIFDTADPGSGEWLPTLPLARERLTGLELKPANGSVTEVLSKAYRLLHALDDDPDQHNDPLPRFLYAFSDRTRESWDAARVPALVQLRDQNKTKILAALVDVGVDQPVDLAITDLDLPRQVIPANSRAVFRTRVQAVGKDYDTEILCRLDDEKTAERRALKLKAGQNDVIVFERRNLALGLHQAEISLAAPDNLPFNNARFATFEVTGARKVLAISDNPDEAAIWKLALRVGEQKGDPAFDCETKSTLDAGKMLDFNSYKAVCLFNVKRPDAELWKKLAAYVENGGSLVILPGGDELNPLAYDTAEARVLMPGTFQKIIRRPLDKPVVWKESYQPPVKEWFVEWNKPHDPQVDFVQIPPKTYAYWKVEFQREQAFLPALYDDADKLPALLERKFDKQKVRGKVLLFTTPLDGRRLEGDYSWNNFLTSSFYVSLAKKLVGYLTGDLEDANLNHLCGQAVRLTLPPTGRFPNYVLQGPGLQGQAGLIARTPTQQELVLTQAVRPGNFQLLSGDATWRTGFSLNVLPAESDLARVPAESIETLFGPGSILPISHNIRFRDAMQSHWGQPLELFPWLMIGLLLVLAVENLLANKFYRRSAAENEKLGTEQHA